MAGQDRYPVPAGTHRTEQVIERSRFIASVARADSVEQASVFVRAVGAQHAGATHNCWAYLIGTPGSTARIGMSDDGEPHGTAGRPMLTVLLHSGLGDVAAVVTRYYGGVKLGTGGLVRAYGGTLQQALATLPRIDRVSYAALELRVDYPAVAVVQQLLAAHEALVDGEEYGEQVSYRVRVPEGRLAAFRDAVLDATRGRAVLRAPLNG